jgi:hypothetical protein
VTLAEAACDATIGPDVVMYLGILAFVAFVMWLLLR